MNKQQKWLIAISTIIFLFVTLNPSVFRVGLKKTRYKMVGDTTWTTRISRKPYFSTQPMYHYWAVIAVPSAVLFFIFKKEEREKK